MLSRRMLFGTIAVVFVAMVSFSTFNILVPTPQEHSNPNTELQSQPSPTRDPVLRMPGMVEFIRKYPSDWEQRLYPDIQAMVLFQRKIGEHGTVVSYGDQQMSLSNPNPKVRVFIADWDGTDLFVRGVPKTYNGKPVELVPVQGQTQPAGN